MLEKTTRAMSSPAHEDFEDEPFHAWYENAYDRLFDKWNDFHHQIEQYLGTIDLQYGTNFEPTGALRGFLASFPMWTGEIPVLKSTQHD